MFRLFPSFLLTFVISTLVTCAWAMDWTESQAEEFEQERVGDAHAFTQLKLPQAHTVRIKYLGNCYIDANQAHILEIEDFHQLARIDASSLERFRIGKQEGNLCFEFNPASMGSTCNNNASMSYQRNFNTVTNSLMQEAGLILVEQQVTLTKHDGSVLSISKNSIIKNKDERRPKLFPFFLEVFRVRAATWAILTGVLMIGVSWYLGSGEASK